MIFLTLLFLLSSCSLSMSKQEQSAYLLPQISIEESLLSGMSRDVFHMGTWPKDDWWQEFQIDQLSAMIEAALEQNPSIQAAKERISMAASTSIISRSKLFPLITFNGSDQWELLSHHGLYRALNPSIGINNQQIDLSLSFNYEFDFWGKYRNLYQAALGKQKAQLAESKNVELIISTAIAQAYFALQALVTKKGLYQDLYELHRRDLNLAKSLNESSLSSLFYPLLLDQKLLAVIQQLDELDQEISVTKHLINILVGRSPDFPIDASLELHPLSIPWVLPNTLQAELLSRRPDLIAQAWRISALAHEVGAAKAEFFPNVNLLAFVGLQSGSWEKLFELASKSLGLLPSIGLPIYTAGAIRAGVDKKTAEFQEQVFLYNALILRSFQEVSDLISLGKAIHSQYEEQSKIVTDALKRADLAFTNQANGLINLIELNAIADEWIVHKIQSINLAYDQYVIAIHLIKALGGGYLPQEAPSI